MHKGGHVDIYEALRQDHEEVRSIFEKLMESSSRAAKTREKEFQRLQKELVPHEHAEEKVFYPALLNGEFREDTLQALEEHHAADVMITELKQLSMDDERWNAKLAVLRDMVEHHIEEEEGKIFDDAGDVLSEDQADELGRQFDAKKKELQAAM